MNLSLPGASVKVSASCAMDKPTIKIYELRHMPYLGNEAVFVLSMQKAAYSQLLKKIAWLIKASAALLGTQPAQHISIGVTPASEFTNEMSTTNMRQSEFGLFAWSSRLTIARLKPNNRSALSNMQFQSQCFLGTYSALVALGAPRTVTGLSL